MNNAVLSIGITEAKAAAENEPSLDGMLRAAMQAMKNHWMITDENEQLKAAVAAVMLLSDEETKDKITREWKAAAAFSALLSGLPIDMSCVDMPENPIGIMKIWREVTAK